MRELLYKMANYRKQERPTWIIWGAGYRGLLVLKYIKQLNDENVLFADNNVQKQGKKIESIMCISRKEVERIADNSIIIVTPYSSSSDDLYDDLSSEFPYVIPSIILEILNYYPKAHGFDGFMPLGHYYSLYPNMIEIEKKSEALHSTDQDVMDIDFNVEEQYSLLEEMQDLLPSKPSWTRESDYAVSKYRYQTDATAFCVPDATCLHMMLRIIKPKRLIEVGSGWSSAVTLDTNEFYLNHEMKVSFVEPYPDTLQRILKKEDSYEIRKCGLEDVDLRYFEQLNKGDILFVDSTHVSKMGSDVNYLLFEILPRLKSGVYIHFHDIFYPFEYPEEWIKKEGWIWNELYLLRSFLMNNRDYKIIFFFDYLVKMHSEKVQECLQMPNASGGSFWIKKL